MRATYYRAILFDFDGTLVDTMSTYANIAAEQMKRFYGIPEESARQLYLQTSGMPFDQQLEMVFGSSLYHMQCVREFEARKALFLQRVGLTQATLTALSEIRALGVSTAITSNNSQALLSEFFCREPNLFDQVLGYDEQLSKGPLQFSAVIDKLGLDRRHILFVGDSLCDLKKAAAFGIDFVALCGTFRPEEFAAFDPAVPVIHSLTELVGLLETNKPIRYEVSST